MKESKKQNNHFKTNNKTNTDTFQRLAFGWQTPSESETSSDFGNKLCALLQPVVCDGGYAQFSRVI